jgi:hypothetical protein
MEEKAADECAGRMFWRECRVRGNLPLQGLIFPFYFSSPFITSRGANPKTYVYRSMTFETAVAAAASMR